MRRKFLKLNLSKPVDPDARSPAWHSLARGFWMV